MTKKKKRLRLAGAAIFLAVLAIIYVLVLQADFNAEDAVEEEDTLSVLSVERDTIRTAWIENSQGTLRLMYDGEVWTSEDDPAFELNQDSVNALFNRLNPLEAIRDLGEQEELADYGLEEPVITITVTLEDGQELTVYLGNEASDGNLYFMTSENGHVYTGDSYLTAAFDCSLADLEAEEETEETETEETESEETGGNNGQETEAADGE